VYCRNNRKCLGSTVQLVLLRHRREDCASWEYRGGHTRKYMIITSAATRFGKPTLSATATNSMGKWPANSMISMRYASAREGNHSGGYARHSATTRRRRLGSSPFKRLIGRVQWLDWHSSENISIRGLRCPVDPSRDRGDVQNMFVSF